MPSTTLRRAGQRSLHSTGLAHARRHVRRQAWRSLRLEPLESRHLLTMTINATIGATILADHNAAAITAAINRTVQDYDSLISDSITVDITFEEGDLGPNVVGKSNGGVYVSETYSAYRARLVSHATSSTDNSAISSLPIQVNEPVNGQATVNMKAPLARALGFDAPGAGGAAGDGTITLGKDVCNPDRTSIDGSKYDLQAVISHELDEELGFASFLDQAYNGSPTPSGPINPDDLFRYSNPGARSASEYAGATAYFSINSGVTNLEQFNQGSTAKQPRDRNDWADSSSVQGFATKGGAPNLNVEIIELDAIGYTLTNYQTLAVTAPANQREVTGTPWTFDLGSFSEGPYISAAPWGVTVSWGDGSANTSFILNAPGAIGSKPHVYSSAGTYGASVTVTDFFNQTQTKYFQVNVGSAWAVTNLGTLPGYTSSIATGINASGQVVGYDTNSSGGKEAFLYSGGVMHDLFPGVANGISASGQVVGQLANGHAFLYANGVTTDLFAGTANAISNNGIIVGRLASGNAFKYNIGTGVTTDLGTLPGDINHFGSEALGVNPSGQLVVGWSGSADTYGEFQEAKDAFYYNFAGMHNFGFDGYPLAEGTGANDNGWVVGLFSGYAFLHNGTMVNLGALPGGTSGSIAKGINAGGQVVGSSSAAGGGQDAFLYTDGTMYDLNAFIYSSFISPASGWQLTTANGNNDAGQVVGQAIVGVKSVAYILDTNPILTPVVRSPVHIPGGILSNQPFTTTVNIVDNYGNIDSAYSGNVTISLGSNSGTVTLGGATTVQAVNGVATFNLTPSGLGTFTLVASGDFVTASAPTAPITAVDQAVRYTVTNVGTLPGGTQSTATGVNASGQVVGFSNATGGVVHAFLYSSGTIMDLGTLPGGTFSEATGINANGLVVGVASTATSSQHAFLYSGGIMHDLGTLPGGNASAATAVNTNGQVVGWSYTSSGNKHAFLYANGVMQDLGTLPGGGVSEADAINAAGQIVGSSTTANGTTHAFLYSSGSMQDLGTLPGGKYSGATGINTSGQVVGWSDGTAGSQDAFLYSGGTISDLGTMGGALSEATGINTSGQVVGWANTLGGQVAVLDTGAAIQDLNWSINPLSGWTLSTALGINDVGQIVGQGTFGGKNLAMLLTPAPNQAVIAVQPPGSVRAGQLFGIKIQAMDASGNPDPTYNGPVSVSVASQTGTGTLGGTTTVQAVNGVATFKALSLNGAGGTYRLAASGNNLTTSAPSNLIVLPGVAAISIQPPAAVLADHPFSLTVVAKNASGNVDSTYNGYLNIVVATNTGQGDLEGTTSVQAHNGVAVFDQLELNGVGGAFTLIATGENISTSAPSAPVSVIAAPQVVSVLVDGTNWTPAFMNALQALGEGNGHGFAFPVGSPAQFSPLPWISVDQIQIVFNENVTVLPSNLVLQGASVSQHPFSGFSYDKNAFTATWTLATPLGGDGYVLNLDGHSAIGVHDAAGLQLDGEWANGSSRYPSGNEAPSGDFTFAFGVLPGDLNRDGVVNGLDIATVASNWPPHSYQMNADANGDGVTNGLDISAIASNWLKFFPALYTLPTATAVAASATTAAYGQGVDLTATVSAKYTPNEGAVTFFDGGNKIGVATVIDGTATLAGLTLSAGSHVITATYGDSGGIYLPSSTTVGPSSIIRTIAGNGTASYSGDGGAATSASLFFPTRTVVDAAGNLFIADTVNNRVRKVDHATGVITTVAGTGTAGFSGDNGLATSARLNNPIGLAFDASGNLYIADSANNRLREVLAIGGAITTNSTIRTVAGTGTAGYNGDSIQPTSAQLNTPYGVAIDAAGDVFIADFNNQRIREVSIGTGLISTVAGNGSAGFSGDNGPATAAALHLPAGLAVDAAGNVFFADALNHRIREVNHATGVITTVAGNGTAGFSGDGAAATAASLNNPVDVAVDTGGDLFIVDYNNQRIREVNYFTGVITTVAGNGSAGFSGDGGLATAAKLNTAYGVAVDSGGDLLIADEINNRIREVAGGVTVTVTPLATSTSVVAAPTVVSFVIPVTLIATVTSSLAPNEGTVTFYSNGTSVGSVPVTGGIAVINVLLPIGTDLVTAVYSDVGGNFTGSSTPTAQTVVVLPTLPGGGSGTSETAVDSASASTTLAPPVAAAYRSLPSISTPQLPDRSAVYFSSRGPVAAIDNIMAHSAGVDEVNVGQLRHNKHPMSMPAFARSSTRAIAATTFVPEELLTRLVDDDQLASLAIDRESKKG